MTATQEKTELQKSATRSAKFEELVMLHQRQLVSVAYRMLGNLEDARDYVQEAFVRFWQLSSWPEKGNEILSLLNRIVMNLCIDALRRLRRFRLIGLSKDELDTSKSGDIRL